jgi:RNA polymerase sigma-70 factor, ECF subfamily
MVDMSHKTDIELVKLALKNVEAFGYLIERYEQKLLRYIYRLTGVQENSEDILQEAFLKIYTNLNSFDTHLSFSAWAYRITHNEIINSIRKNKNHTKNISLDLENENMTSLLDILADNTNIEEEIYQKQQAQKIHEILFLLPLKYREILILRYLEEKDYLEISDILRIPTGTVATLLNRAKKQAKVLAEKVT